jgi:epoxyqueuosine reductase QueG
MSCFLLFDPCTFNFCSRWESIIQADRNLGGVSSDWLRDLATEVGFDMISVVDPSEIDANTTFSRVIVLGMITPDESAEFTLKVNIGGKERWSKWIYEALENMARKLAWELMEKGIRAEPFEFTDSWNKIDLKRAAVAGGLGVMGENNLVLNREWGPRMRFTAVFADIDSETDKPLNIELCNMCTVCIRECPTGALDRAIFDRSKCIAEFDPDESMKIMQEEMVNWITKFTKEQCSICITSCPLGGFNRMKPLTGF